MGLMDSGVEALALTKAVIEVVDHTDKQKEDKEIIGCVGKMNDFIEKKAEYSAVKGKLVLKKEALKAGEKSVVQLGDSVELQYFNELTKSLNKAAKIRRFEVQFNPSTLSVSGFGGGKVQITNFGSKDSSDRGVSYEEASPQIEMSVQLVFDETDNFTAFPGDIMGLNVSNVANTAANMGLKALSGRPSVQTTVEGFLGAIRNQYTRSVAFCWGRMLYFGYVNRVNTRYTLFNPSGKPVRATVDLNIVCADSAVNKESLGYWHEKYDEFFSADKSYKGFGDGLVNLSNF